MKYFILLISIAFFFSACEKNENSQSKIKLKRSQNFYDLNHDSERLAAADFIENYLNVMFDSSQTYRNTFWQSTLLYNRSDRFLKVGRAKSYLIEFPPQLLGIRKDEGGLLKAKIAFFRDEFPEEIMELTIDKDAEGKFYFIETIGSKVKAFDQSERGGIQFFYSPECKLDSAAEKKVVAYNKSLADYFNSTERPLRVIVCKNLEDYAELHGVDYASYLNIDRQTGGRAMPEENLYISANGSPYYPHELVHIYTADLDPHPFMDEGLATYLGGSGGISLNDHLKKGAPLRDSFDFSQLPDDFYLYESFQANYIIGGLLLKLAQEEHGGRESVFKLLSTGKEDEQLFTTLDSIFGIEREQFDEFVKNELAKYADKDSSL